MKHLDVAVAIVFRDAKLLIARRKADSDLGGFWEFPGGKVEAGETLHDCVCRELFEELSIRVQPVVSLPPVEHQYPDRHVTLHAFLCTWTEKSVTPRPDAADEIRWVTPAELLTFKFPPANATLIQQVIAAFPDAGARLTPSAPRKQHNRQPAIV